MQLPKKKNVLSQIFDISDVSSMRMQLSEDLKTSPRGIIILFAFSLPFFGHEFDLFFSLPPTAIRIVCGEYNGKAGEDGRISVN